MSPKINLVNRQRCRKLEAAGLRSIVARLVEELCRNLALNPCNWLDEDRLSLIEERGAFNIVLVSDKSIRKLNREYRGIDKATDVLSFPLDLMDDDFIDCDEETEIGEIFVSVEKAEEQSEEYGHSFERELAFLIVHGLLHVLGFDHQTSEEEKDMFARQEDILSSCGFTRVSQDSTARSRC